MVQDPVKYRNGIATGHITVKPKKDADITSLVKKYDLEVAHVVPHLNIISLAPRDQSKLLEVSAMLSESELLTSVKLDISYGGPRAK